MFVNIIIEGEIAMGKKKRTKKLTKKQLKQRRQLLKNTVISTLLLLLVLGVSYLIFVTDVLEPHVNEVTAGYISFYNNDTTDMIKINNLKKLSDDVGKSIVNTRSQELKVTGENNNKYQVVVYPMINNIDLKYINFSITKGEITYTNNLEDMPIGDDEGIIVYQGNVSEGKELTLRMWISKEYEGKIDNNSFSVKINPGQEN